MHGDTQHNAKYNSQELDTETGYYFYNARHYDPVICRFVTADSVVDGEMVPVGWNRYAYTHGNPVMYKDPTGHDLGAAFNAFSTYFATKDQTSAQDVADVGQGIKDSRDAATVNAALDVVSSATNYHILRNQIKNINAHLKKSELKTQFARKVAEKIAKIDETYPEELRIQPDANSSQGYRNAFGGSDTVAGFGIGIATGIWISKTVEPVRRFTLLEKLIAKAKKVFGVKAGGNLTATPYQVRIDPITGKGPMAIDSSAFTSGKTTLNGGIRNSKQFWKHWKNIYNNTLSDANKLAIKNKMSPIVDDEWIKHFPEHAPFKGETLIHHHLDYGKWSIPLPETVHGMQPGWGIWHYLH